MSKEKIQKRTKMKPFLKYVNYTHLMPTRYVVDLDLKKIVDESGLKEGKAEARKAIKKVFEERYHQQSSAKKEKKAAGTMYFYKKHPCPVLHRRHRAVRYPRRPRVRPLRSAFSAGLCPA